jgi:hypothetical protein
LPENQPWYALKFRSCIYRLGKHSRN